MFNRCGRGVLTFPSCLNRYKFPNIKSHISICKYLSTEAELANIFNQEGPPKYDKVLPPPTKKPEVNELAEVKTKEKTSRENIFIECKRPEFNHYKNQRYDKLSPIPLASKGWHHTKSKGDYFTIKLRGKENINDIFWREDGKSFEQLNIDPPIIEAMKSLKIDRPTIVQEESIPVLLSGRNAIIAAETGCGKTLAYLLPIVQQIIKWNKVCPERPPNNPLAVIMCPGRELALQIGEIVKALSHQLPFRCNVLIGGRTKQKMLNPNFQQVDLQIATPGVLSKLTTLGLYNLSEVRHLVLDEADTLLDDSFSEHLTHFLKKFQIVYKRNPKDELPKGCQLSLVSATQPTSIYDILQEFIEPDSLVKIKAPKLHRILSHVPQVFYKMLPSERASRLLTIAKQAVKEQIPTIIFSNKSSTSDWVSLMLHENDVPALNLNAQMPLLIRAGKFQEFREGGYMIFSSTDIASRGLDTKHVRQVINFDFPLYMADYIHRCGRTGRCGSPADCKIINFVCGDREVDLVNKIEMSVRTMEDLPNVNGNITKLIKRNILKKTQFV